ncbi:MAG: DEAD/DEAH box helicase [Christensenellales bacterium]
MRPPSKRRKRIAALSVLGCDTDEKAKEYAADLAAFTRAGESIYADFDPAVFFESARFMRINSPYLYLGYYADAYERVERTRAEFRRIFAISPSLKTGEIGDELDRIALIARNLDRIGGWCRYQSVADECRRSGFEFVLEPLSLGEITPDDVLSCFKKCVYYNFVRSEIALDDRLCQFSGLALEETIERFRAASDEYERLVRADLYRKLVANIPAPHADGDHNLEKVVLLRAVKNGVKGITLRKLFTLIPTIMKFACPCMLMSPSSVTQFLDLGLDKFDLVVFDEASQVQTCKAVGTIARADRVIVVGDPKQLPPTSFFGADFRDDEHLETEDLESILDDCLAVGMPERRLTWHYRSHHESLIAFSNANFYDNGLLTFPSPSEKDGRVSLCYVDGVYERGGAKHNKREAQELVRDVISRLKNPALAAQSVGVVTFNTAQQAYIEDALGKAIAEHGLESVAYERDEPIFVKNLENVQGDERDVILFSVGYGPDKDGKLSLNFGPLNQAGGERRLNVAASRARRNEGFRP